MSGTYLQNACKSEAAHKIGSTLTSAMSSGDLAAFLWPDVVTVNKDAQQNHQYHCGRITFVH